MADDKQNPAQEPEQAVEQGAEAQAANEQPVEELSPEAEIAALSADLADANARIAELEKELVELQPRAQAEIQNIRRRAEQDVDKARKFALEKFTSELLPVVDSLERALESAPEDEASQGLREGVEMTLKLLLGGMAKFNVEAVDPKGDAFNPEHHQAMSMIAMPGAEPNTVIDVMQKGYLLNGRLVRPAMVVVAKA